MDNDQIVNALKKFVDEMESIAHVRYECSRREIETIRQLIIEIKSDHPEFLHDMFSKHPRVRDGNR